MSVVAPEPPGAAGAGPTRCWAGPFLRYGGGTGGEDAGSWRGSVLFLTRKDYPPGQLPPSIAAAAGGAAAAGPASSSGADEPEQRKQQQQQQQQRHQQQQQGHHQQQGQQQLPGPTTAAPTLVVTDATASGEQRPTAVHLDTAFEWTFWRFDLSFELTAWQRPISYQLHVAGGATTPCYTFFIPAAGQPMHFGYYSCNGFSASVRDDAPERQDPTYMWRDMLQLHSAFPLHCLIGGGDQLYCDGVFKDEGSAALKAWGEGRNHGVKVSAPFSEDMLEQSTRFYLDHYIAVFGEKDVCDALASIPTCMQWDDHDCWDGYGSYDDDMQTCPVFKGLFGVARRFYLLFQQHTTDAFNATAQEFLNNDGSDFHFIKYLGPLVVLLGIDMRSQRTKSRILPQATYEQLEAAVAALPPGSQHLLVLSGIPVIFPKVPAAESVLGLIARMSRAMPRFRKIVRKAGILDRFDQPEILDDILDGWVAGVHKAERLQFIRLLQHFAKTKALRVSIISGDAHVGGVARFYSRPKAKPLGSDPLFIPQIISSAIMNAPPGHGIIRMLVRTNFAAKVDKHTKEKFVRAFYPQHLRTDKLLAQRNWCDISMVAPPFSPPTHPLDPNFGGLRFSMRVEDAKHRRGHAEEVYHIVIPRHPEAGKATVATGAPAAGGAAPTAGGPPSPGVPLHLAAEFELPAQGQAA